MIVNTDAIPDDYMGLDIGPETIKEFSDAIKNAGTVIWNGPMGVFEFERFAVGNKSRSPKLSRTADRSASSAAATAAAAVQQLGYADKMTHISTGGGASLEFLEGLELPGVACLLDK